MAERRIENQAISKVRHLKTNVLNDATCVCRPDNDKRIEFGCHGFAQETIETIKNDVLRDELSRLLVTKYERYRERYNEQSGDETDA